MVAAITKADDRLKRRPKVNILMTGPSGVGKTTQAGTLPEAETLFIDLEAGMLSLEQDRIDAHGQPARPWGGDSINVREQSLKLNCKPWELARAIACLLSGPDPTVDPTNAYSKTAYDYYATNVFHPDTFKQYNYIFVDSITVASRMAFAWAKTQPQAFSEKTGKPDMRGAYGLLGQEMIQWATQLQHTPEKNIILAGILDKIKDEYGRFTFELQIDGTMAKNALPGIFDEVLTLGRFSYDAQTNAMAFDHEKGEHRAFICKENNPFGVPGKDRSGKLGMIEPPNLYGLIQKIQHSKSANNLVTTIPATSAQPVPAGQPGQQQAA